MNSCGGIEIEYHLGDFHQCVVRVQSCKESGMCAIQKYPNSFLILCHKDVHSGDLHNTDRDV